jgi:hypothetical protein
MARKRIYNHIRFDGGMTDSPRDTSDLTKLAYISHLDIYRDPSEMFVMPGFTAVNGFSGNANAIKTYQPQDVAGNFGRTFLLAKKSDGTGSKIFQIDVGETQWKASTIHTVSEGADNLVARPFLTTIGTSPTVYFPVELSSEERIARFTTSAYSATWATTSGAPALPSRRNFIRNTPADKVLFTTGNPHVSELSASAVTWVGKSTQDGVLDIATGEYQVAIASGSLDRGRVLLWDDASLLADQKNDAGIGFPRAIGAPSQVFTVVCDEFLTGDASSNNNGDSGMSVKAIRGESINTMYRLRGYRTSDNLLYSTKVGYKDTMTWYTYFATNVGATEFENGVWAFGKGGINSQMGVSKLLDTSSLGIVRQSRWIGDNIWFVGHSGDWSVSRLSDFETGTYNVPATIETLIYGADNPYLKELNGISVVTEDLPAGGSVVVSYRIDENSAWTIMGTSDTTGKRKHNFTKANGTPIGRFQEIQFKIVITGKTAVKNIMVAVTETDDLSF